MKKLVILALTLFVSFTLPAIAMTTTDCHATAHSCSDTNICNNPGGKAVPVAVASMLILGILPERPQRKFEDVEEVSTKRKKRR